jgi:ribosomal protein L11 methyltransferase
LAFSNPSATSYLTEQPMKNYARLVFSTDMLTLDAITAGMFDLGCEGIEEKAQDEWIAFFTEERVEKARRFLENRGIQSQAIKVENRDWNAEWKRSIRPLRLTRTFWVAPAWLQAEIQGQSALWIEPKMAFGSGHHETTRLCAQFLEECAPGARSMMDAGTGSGLLAILGEKLGLSHIVALDNDPVILGNLAENILQNGCTKIRPFIGTLDALNHAPRFDIITANIISSVIFPLLPRFWECMHAQSKLILSGLLVAEKGAVLETLKRNRLAAAAEKTQGEWVAVVALRSDAVP